MEVLLLVVMGTVNILCFMIGAKVGQTVSKGEDIVLPKARLVERMVEHRYNRIMEQEKNKYDTILRNIDSYDGTGDGQKDVPR